MSPRRITDNISMQIARRTRDDMWVLMDRLARQGIVHVCTWNKNRRPQGRNELRCGLLDWFGYASWIHRHRPWFRYGCWDRRRDTFPMSLTPAGRIALRRRSPRDDRSMVYGGLVEPGYQVQPRDFHRRLREQLRRNRRAWP